MASPLTLRRSIGVMGILLPFVLVTGQLVMDPGSGLRTSISAYYATPMRDVLTGALFAIGFCLFAYRGYERVDDLVGNVAAICCVGIALFPSTSDSGLSRQVHAWASLALFLLLSYYSAFLFTRTDPRSEPTRAKVQRNRVYLASGTVMMTCVVLGTLYYAFLEQTAVSAFKPVFWLESLALWAIGWSWFVKGRTLLTDRPILSVSPSQTPDGPA